MRVTAYIHYFPRKETKTNKLSQETRSQLSASSNSIHFVQEQFRESVFIFEHIVL